MSLTLHEANRLFSYNPACGSFAWKESLGPRSVAGSPAALKPKGPSKVRYAGIVVGKRRYPAHRIAWLLTHGEWPEGEIDHINGDTFDNRIENLRVVDRIANTRNCALRKDSASGIYGVNWHKKKKRWMVHIGVGGRSVQLGGLRDFFEACCIRKSAELLHGYSARHGVAT